MAVMMEMDAKTLAQDITLTVTIKTKRYRQWLWRIAVAKWLIRLAAWVMWVDLDLKVEYGS